MAICTNKIDKWLTTYSGRSVEATYSCGRTGPIGELLLCGDCEPERERRLAHDCEMGGYENDS